MWNIEYLDADGKGFSDTEPWCEEGIETEETLNDILESMKRRGCINIKVINLEQYKVIYKGFNGGFSMSKEMDLKSAKTYKQKLIDMNYPEVHIIKIIG